MAKASMNTNLDELIANIREQVLYMQELGVVGMDARIESGELRIENAAIPIEQAQPSAGSEISDLRSEISNKPERPAGSRLGDLPSLTTRKSPEFFDKYNPEEDGRRETEDGRQETQGRTADLPEPTETIEQIRAEIGPDCTRCPLCTMGRKQVVNSVGNFNAVLMFVGEAPGADEDLTGVPFVGRSGQLLTEIITKGMGIPRAEVAIANVLKCRPPDNRPPTKEEKATCTPWLDRQIELIDPKVIIPLGRHAAMHVLQVEATMGAMRQKVHEGGGRKVVPTYHPWYLPRRPGEKKECWKDIQLAMGVLGLRVEK